MPPSGEWYIALYDFAAPEENDLRFAIGDRIWVTETRDDWWKGTLNGREGIFPANYVVKAGETRENGESCEGRRERDSGVDARATMREVGRAVAAFEATAANQLSLAIGDLVHIRSKSDGGWWEGEIERVPGQPPVAGWFPGNYIVLESTGNAITSVRSDDCH